MKSRMNVVALIVAMFVNDDYPHFWQWTLTASQRHDTFIIDPVGRRSNGNRLQNDEIDYSSVVVWVTVDTVTSQSSRPRWISPQMDATSWNICSVQSLLPTMTITRTNLESAVIVACSSVSRFILTGTRNVFRDANLIILKKVTAQHSHIRNSLAVLYILTHMTIVLISVSPVTWRARQIIACCDLTTCPGMEDTSHDKNKKWEIRNKTTSKLLHLLQA